MEKTAFDTTLRPQDDFFGYVNNHWLKDNPIPASEAVWGTFYALRDEAWSALHKIIKDLISSDDSSLSHDQKLLKDFFTCALNFDDYKDNHLRTLKDDLAEIASINDTAALSAYVGTAQSHGVSSFWNHYVDLDDKNSQKHSLRFYQSGISMHRDYYLEPSEKMESIRRKYEQYFTDATQIAGIDLSWETVWSVELGLAQNSWTDVALRDIQKNYNHHTLDSLHSTYPNIDWQEYYKGLGWKTPSDNIIIGQPSYFEHINSLFKERPLEELKAYLSWRIISASMSWLSNRSAEISNDFFGKTISGIKDMKPLWKRAVLLADRYIIGEALGREYAARHFPESSKQAALNIVENIRATFHARIDRLNWMEDATKKRAHTKLDNMKVLIGYPSSWKDLSSLRFVDDNHAENMRRAIMFEVDIELAKVGNKPAEEEWEMNAHTVNAYHHPNRLEIVFPAAILQPPFYDPSASLSTNLGGIGAVIGHELTHGFDDQGSEFDEQGNTNPWQTEDERKEFDRLAQHIVDQADNFETVPGTHLQGKLILGEAIADIGGLELAVEALSEKHPVKDDDFMQNLRELFITAARCECGQATPERLIELAKVDPHPPSRFRVNSTFAHVDAFYDAFGIKPTDALYLPPEMRSRIW